MLLDGFNEITYVKNEDELWFKEKEIKSYYNFYVKASRVLCKNNSSLKLIKEINRLIEVSHIRYNNIFVVPKTKGSISKQNSVRL